MNLFQEISNPKNIIIFALLILCITLFLLYYNTVPISQVEPWARFGQAVGALLAAVAGFSALFVSLNTSKRQQDLQESIHKERKEFTRELHEEQREVRRSVHEEQKKIHEQQVELRRGQIIVPVWDKLMTLRRINEDDPDWEYVVRVVNTLELVAVLWEANLIDPNIIRRTFRQSYIELWEQLTRCTDPPREDRFDSGPELQRQNRAAAKLYEKLKEEHQEQDSLE